MRESRTKVEDLVQGQTKIKQVVICAKGPGWAESNMDEEKGVGPFACPEEEISIWGVNAVCTWRPVDVEFHMHHLDPRQDKDSINQRTFEKILRSNVPLVTLDKYKEFPSSIKFPFKWVWETFNTDYISNSISYMIAFALYIGVKKIDMYGVNMSTQVEYMMEKGNVESWCSIARGYGATVTIHRNEWCAIEKSGDNLIYGYAVPMKGLPCKVAIRATGPQGSSPGLIKPDEAIWKHPLAIAGVHPSEWPDDYVVVPGPTQQAEQPLPQGPPPGPGIQIDMGKLLGNIERFNRWAEEHDKEDQADGVDNSG
jgi:hypothetical protein